MRLFSDSEIDSNSLGESQIKQMIAPVQSRLVQCCRDGLRLTREYVTRQGHLEMSPRTKANFLSDVIKRRAEEAFDDDPRFRCDMALGFFKLYGFDEQLVLRFKKTGPDWLARNVATDQQRRWFANHPMQGVNNQSIRLTVAFRLSDTEEELSDVQITRQTSRKNLLWMFPILEHGTVQQSSKHDFGEELQLRKQGSIPQPKIKLKAEGRAEEKRG